MNRIPVFLVQVFIVSSCKDSSVDQIPDGKIQETVILRMDSTVIPGVKPYLITVDAKIDTTTNNEANLFVDSTVIDANGSGVYCIKGYRRHWILFLQYLQIDYSSDTSMNWGMGTFTFKRAV